MGLSKEQGNNGFCRMSSNRTGQGSRFPVTECKGFKRVKTKLNSFSKTVSSVGTPNLGLFRSRVSRQVPVYIFWKLYPHNKARAAFQTLWSHLYGYAFSVNRLHSRQSIDRAYIFDFSNDMTSTVRISTTKKSSFSTKDARSIGWSKSRKFLFNRKTKLLAWAVS